MLKKISSFIVILVFSLVIVFSTACNDENEKYEGSVILISVDGMRPDAINSIEYGNYLKSISTYSLSVETVNPSITLPCHTSMLYGVLPSVHGITTNTYTPSENIGKSVMDILSDNSLKSATFYNWKQIGDIINDNSVAQKTYIGGEIHGWEEANESLGVEFVDYIQTNEFDFAFLYLGFLDEWGHRFGWLSNEYFYALDKSMQIVNNVIEKAPKNSTIILTSDHGGHDNTHGTTLKEDMTIPIYLIGNYFEKGKELNNLTMLNVAPTILSLLNIQKPTTWQGESII